MKRLSKLFIDLGYCSRKTAPSFYKCNQIEVEGKDIRKLRRNAFVDWKTVTVNGRPLEYGNDDLTLLVNKPPLMRSGCADDYAAFYGVVRPAVPGEKRGLERFGIQRPTKIRQKFAKNQELVENSPIQRAVVRLTDADESTSNQSDLMRQFEDTEQMEQDEEEDSGEIFDLLPELFVFRSPELKILNPLPDSLSGLTVLTQDEDLYNRLISVRTPLKRVYEVQVSQSYTGLEDEALKLFRGDIKPSVKMLIPAPKFNIVDEKNKIAHVVLYDYKPDKIVDMLVSMRHEPLNVRRIGVGNVLLATDTTREMHRRELAQSKADNRAVSSVAPVELGEAEWCEMNEEQLRKLREPQQEIVDRRFKARQTQLDQSKSRDKSEQQKPVAGASTWMKHMHTMHKEGSVLHNVRMPDVQLTRKEIEVMGKLFNTMDDDDFGLGEEEDEYEPGERSSRAAIDSIFDADDDDDDLDLSIGGGKNNNDMSRVGSKLRKLTSGSTMDVTSVTSKLKNPSARKHKRE